MRQITIVAGVLTLAVLLLLIFNIYNIWVATVFALLLGALIIVIIGSTQILPPCKFRIKELYFVVNFLDDTGKLAHVKMEFETKPFKGIADSYTDRGLAGTGKIENLKSFRYLDGEWREIKISSSVREGSQTALTTPMDPPLSHKEWAKRKLEFDCIDCFTENEESIVYRVESITGVCFVTLNFDRRRKPKEVTVSEFIGGIENKLPPLPPSSTKPEVFSWSKKKPPLGGDFLFSWVWEQSSQNRKT